MAGGQGLEPWITGPEPVVLPLYYPPVIKKIKFTDFTKNVKGKSIFRGEKYRKSGIIIRISGPTAVLLIDNSPLNFKQAWFEKPITDPALMRGPQARACRLFLFLDLHIR